MGCLAPKKCPSMSGMYFLKSLKLTGTAFGVDHQEEGCDSQNL